MHQELLSLTDDTLFLLRRIRSAVLASTPPTFNEKERETAELLIDGLTEVALAVFGKSEEDPRDLVDKHTALIEQTTPIYGKLSPSWATGSTGTVCLISYMELVAKQYHSNWNFILENNRLTTDLKPKDGDVIVSPLSSGPILLRVAQRVLESPAKLALAATDPHDFFEKVFRNKEGHAYLPDRTSWPSDELRTNMPGRFIILDDLRASGTTARDVSQELQRKFQIAESEIIGH